MGETTRKPDSNTDTIITDQVIALAFGEIAVLCVLIWLAGSLSAILTGHDWPELTTRQFIPLLVAAVWHPNDLTAAWKSSCGASIGPTWLVYTLAAPLLAGQAFLTALAIRFSLNWRRRREFRLLRLGFASGREVRQMLGRQALLHKSRSVRPSYHHHRHFDPLEVGFYLGRDTRSRQKIFASAEDVFIILAPPRQGKDVHFCAPFTIDAPGACIVTSTRADAFTNTYASRAESGDILVFDPNGLTHWPERLRWSPVRGCEDPLVADTRSVAFITGAGFQMGNDDSFFVSIAITLMRIYLHAAAVGRKSIRDIMRWSTQPTNPEPLAILREGERNRKTPGGWAGEYEACMSREPRTRAIMWSTVVQALGCFSDPAVLDACSPTNDEDFDIETFLAGKNTLYILGKEKKGGSVTPVVTALMEDLFDGARRIAARLPSSRLDPPLTVELNEAAHIAPLPNLPAYMGDSGGFSIALHVYLQSLSQARSKWGDHEAMIMWDNAAVRVIMGGAGNIDDLEAVSRLMGETPDRRAGSAGLRRVLSAEEIRTLPFGTAVVVARAARPVEVRLTPWWKRSDGKKIAAGKKVTEEMILKYSSTPQTLPHSRRPSSQ
jgi:type IV secretion system protein VirD4